MRAVIQRVSKASVTIDGKQRSSISNGLLVLLGICDDDNKEDIDWLSKKIVQLRIFDDEQGIMNKNVEEVDGKVLIVSQFTLYASYKKGNRPSWFRSAKHEISIPLYEAFCNKMTELLPGKIETGVFGADMKVELLNDGPVTICMDTKNKE